ncbi:MAG: hypothetical protein JNM14_05040 [Ferruginibacter sp.]|nr:hypothetical protein [Ferruginibacter sp.]
MKKQTTNQFNFMNAAKNHLKAIGKKLTPKKSSGYVYTEEDLGEGILDVGITAHYTLNQIEGLFSKAWTSLLMRYGNKSLQ